MKPTRVRYGLWKSLKAARSRDKVALRKGRDTSDSRRPILRGKAWLYS